MGEDVKVQSPTARSRLHALAMSPPRVTPKTKTSISCSGNLSLRERHLTYERAQLVCMLNMEGETPAAKLGKAAVLWLLSQAEGGTILRTAYRSTPVRQQGACLTQALREISKYFSICVANIHFCGHWSLLSRLLYGLTLNTPACLDFV